MIDMLVRLYDLPESGGIYRKVEEQGIVLRRARAFERHTVVEFVREHFSPKWVSEVEVAMSRQPVACFIATRDRRVLGFGCHDTTLRGFFGPTGVAEGARGTGVGKALLFKSLEALRELGYAYAIIGGVGPREFYEKACGAIEIPGAIRGLTRICCRDAVMKKSRMFLLFGVLSAMVAGYVAWCSRPFYPRAPLPDLLQAPEEAHSLAISAIEAAGLRDPEKFSIGRFLRLPAKPYDSAPSQIVVFHTGRVDSVFVVWRPHAPHPPMFFVKSETGWKRLESD